MRTRRSLLRSLVAVMGMASAVVAAPGCGLLMSFDYETDPFGGSTPAGQARTYFVRGTMKGLATRGGSVTLASNGVELVVQRDGPFAFVEPIADGRAYSVTSTRTPPKTACAITNASGVISGGDVDVSVSCASSDATLASLSVPELPTLVGQGAFLPEKLSYATKTRARNVFSTPLPSITVQASPADPDARVTLVGLPQVVRGDGKTALQLSSGKNQLLVVVRAPSGAELVYALSIDVEVMDRFEAQTPDVFGGLFGARVAVSQDALAFASKSGLEMYSIDPASLAWKYETTRPNVHGGVTISGTTLAAGTIVQGVEGVDILERVGATWSLGQHLGSPSGSPIFFGASVAISGDRLVVGAPFGSDGGAAFVFARADGVWKAEAQLSPPSPATDMRFGSSVAIDGDTIVVGAPRVAPGYFASGVHGAAYFFERSGTTWTNTDFSSPATVRYDYGAAVAVSGGAVFVGSPGEDAVRVYERKANAWALTELLEAPNRDPDALSQFGSAIVVEGTDLFIGAPLEESAATNLDGDPKAFPRTPEAGAVHHYVRDAGAWSRRTYVKSPDTTAEQRFGSALAVHGGHLVVGAPTEYSAGSAYFFH